MTLTARLLVIVLGVVLLLIVARGLRRHRLRFEVAIPWLVLGVSLVVLSLFQPWADRLARLAGIDYPPSFYVLIGLFVVLVLLFQLSLRISRLGEELKTLVQDLAVLQAEGTLPSRDGPGAGSGSDRDAVDGARAADDGKERP
jgi:hypothetical protein